MSRPDAGADGRIVITSVVPGEPASKQRPRFNTKTGRVYHDDAAVAAEDAIAYQAKADNPGLEPVSGHVGIAARFYCEPRRSIVLEKDADNMLKAVMDAYNKVVWQDDAQVIEINVSVVRGDPEPRSEITVYRMEGSPA